jgi:hypothetical protein
MRHLRKLVAGRSFRVVQLDGSQYTDVAEPEGSDYTDVVQLDRLRGLLSDADRRLTAEMKLSPDEVITTRTTLTCIKRVGDRLAGQQDSWRWCDAIRRERPLLTATVALTTSFALVVGSLAAMHLARGDHHALPALVIASLLVAADLAGVLLRRSRCRTGLPAAAAADNRNPVHGPRRAEVIDAATVRTSAAVAHTAPRSPAVPNASEMECRGSAVSSY